MQLFFTVCILASCFEGFGGFFKNKIWNNFQAWLTSDIIPPAFLTNVYYTQKKCHLVTCTLNEALTPQGV